VSNINAQLHRQEKEDVARLLHAHHQAVVHCGTILLCTLAQVVVQYLQNSNRVLNMMLKE